jgi:hypothetical protein
MKKKIATLLVTVAMAGALLAGPALAQDHYYHHDAHWWSIHHPHEAYPYRGYSYPPGYSYRGPGYPPNYAYNRSHWRMIDGHWHWVRG